MPKLKWSVLLGLVVAGIFAGVGGAEAGKNECTLLLLQTATVTNAAYEYARTDLERARRVLVAHRNRLPWLGFWFRAVDDVTQDLAQNAAVHDPEVIRRAAILTPELISPNAGTLHVIGDRFDEGILAGLILPEIKVVLSGARFRRYYSVGEEPANSTQEVTETGRIAFLADAFEEISTRHPAWVRYFPEVLSSSSAFARHFISRIHLLWTPRLASPLRLRANLTIALGRMDSFVTADTSAFDLLREGTTVNGMVWGDDVNGVRVTQAAQDGAAMRLDRDVALNSLLPVRNTRASAAAGSSNAIWPATSGDWAFLRAALNRVPDPEAHVGSGPQFLTNPYLWQPVITRTSDPSSASR